MLTPSQAYLLDSKMDDGLPQTGGVRAVKETFGAWGNISYDETFVADDIPDRCASVSSANTYNVTNSNNACALIVKMQ